MTKEERLDRIEQLTEEHMIRILESGNLEELPDLATASNYLGKNQRVAEKKKSSVEEEIKKRVAEAEARRRKNS